jgi:hypothetical protein
MRQILFHRDFISRYEESPVAELLGDFDRWLREVRTTLKLGGTLDTCGLRSSVRASYQRIGGSMRRI